MRKLICVLLLLSGCAASGPKYMDINQQDMAANGQQAKIIIYRPNQLLHFATAYWVEINGQQACDLHNDSFMVYGADPGKNIITSSRFSMFGTSRLALNLKAGEVAYVRLDIKASHALFGMLAAATDDTDGPVALSRMTKEEAISEIGSMGSEGGCS